MEFPDWTAVSTEPFPDRCHRSPSVPDPSFPRSLDRWSPDPRIATSWRFDFLTFRRLNARSSPRFPHDETRASTQHSFRRYTISPTPLLLTDDSDPRAALPRSLVAPAPFRSALPSPTSSKTPPHQTTESVTTPRRTIYDLDLSVYDDRRLRSPLPRPPVPSAPSSSALPSPTFSQTPPHQTTEPATIPPRAIYHLNLSSYSDRRIKSPNSGFLAF